MPWARIDDAFDDHPKVLAVLEHEQGGAAIGLWTLCLTWAHRNTLKRGKTPGLIPASLPRRYLGPGARDLAALLVKEGLWEPLAEGDGWHIHDFDLYLPTEKTSAARSEAGKKGAASRWGNRRADSTELGTDGKLPSGDGKLPSGGHHPDGNAVASDGSRAPARRVQVVATTGINPSPDIPVPPTAGADAPGDEPNPGPVVAAFIEGATAAGLKRPAAPIIARVGKQARQLLAEKTYTLSELIDSARTMGAGEWNDLAVQLRKDDAAAKGRGAVVTDRRQAATDQKFERAMARARAKDAQEASQ
jgi:hypothetical protein